MPPLALRFALPMLLASLATPLQLQAAASAATVDHVSGTSLPSTPTFTRRPRFVPISAAGAELMREVWQAGGLRASGPARAVVEQLGREEAPATVAGVTPPKLSIVPPKFGPATARTLSASIGLA